MNNQTILYTIIVFIILFVGFKFLEWYGNKSDNDYKKKMEKYPKAFRSGRNKN